MKIIDTHCDALLKMQIEKRKVWEEDRDLLDFGEALSLDTNLRRLQAGGVQTQFFAIFIEPDVPQNEKWQHALEQIDLFYEDIINKHPEMKHIKKWEELHQLRPGEIGAVLTLEGADAFGNELRKLGTLYWLCILYIGPTLNNVNVRGVGAGR